MTSRADAAAPEHDCPLCGRRAVGGTRHPRAVCETCRGSARCEHGRSVTGANTRFTGLGITVWHVDDRTECVATIAGQRVWVAGQECRILPTATGGVVVETAR